jgi:hypothetical protein
MPLTIGKSASDYEFILTAWLQGRHFHRVPMVISEYAAGGVSDRKRLRSLRERWAILQRARLVTLSLRIYYGGQVLHAIAAKAAKKILPPQVVRWIRSILDY